MWAGGKVNPDLPMCSPVPWGLSWGSLGPCKASMGENQVHREDLRSEVAGSHGRGYLAHSFHLGRRPGLASFWKGKLDAGIENSVLVWG